MTAPRPSMPPPLHPGQTNRLLGYPADARLLIVNADDYGMCRAVNAAVEGALLAGALTSTTVMAPCPFAAAALQYLSIHPTAAFGVHLTAVAEWPGHRWGPVCPAEQVPSLVDAAGNFHDFDRAHALLDHLQLDELEREFQAQIEAVLAAGLQPTHLDWHALRINRRPALQDLLYRLARRNGLALRVAGPEWIEAVQRQGLPANDHHFLDSYSIPPEGKTAAYLALLHSLPAGLSEWALHPGLSGVELAGIDPGGQRTRQADFDFLTSPAARQAIQAEGIVLLDYRPLQAAWRAL